MKRPLSRRLAKVEMQLCPRYEDGCTLDELCRTLWKQDKSMFRKTHRYDLLTYFIPQFEREEQELRFRLRGR